MTPSTTILIVEDTFEDRLLMAHFFTSIGYTVVVAVSGAELRQKIAKEVPVDVILLDVNLPDGNGFALADELHLGDYAGLIFVTSRGEEHDRILGLDVGGDDYVTKPIQLKELAARIRSVLRRRLPKNAANLPDNYREFAGWMLDPVRRELFCPAGELLPLTSGELNVLNALAAAEGNVVGRDYLLDVISNRDPRQVSSHTVDSLIARIRSKMQPRMPADQRSPIETVRGKGYRLLLTPQMLVPAKSPTEYDPLP